MRISDTDLVLIDRGHCPRCGYRGFVLGPRGGLARNIECGNLECRARFNVASTSFSHHLVWGHVIPKQSEGGPSWQREPTLVSMPNIPRDKNFPSSAGQCDNCGGHGCTICNNRGWLAAGHARIRRCERKGCMKPLPPGQLAVYCSNECALADA